MPVRSAFSYLPAACLPVTVLMFTANAFAHGTEANSADAGRVWLEYLVIASLAFAALGYACGVRRLWRNAHAGAGISTRQAGFFGAGWLLLAAALLSPIDTLGSELFSMHMLQHEMMMLGAAPLLVAGKPLVAFIWAFRSASRRRIGAFIRLPSVQRSWTTTTRPLTVWLLHLIVLWAWHFPSLFQASLTNDWVHAAQHGSFLGSALLFWLALIGTQPRTHHAVSHYGSAVLLLLTTLIHTGVLGALLTFSPYPWYPMYNGKTEHWGLTLLEDQQLGGLIMWVPAGFILLAAGLAFAAKAIPHSSTGAEDGALHGEGQA